MALSLLSNPTVKAIMTSLASSPQGLELANAVNYAVASANADPVSLPAAIIATSTSSTVDFGALQVGDLVIHVAATAGSAQFTVCAVAGTLAVAAVVGDLYLVARTFVPPTANAVKF